MCAPIFTECFNVRLLVILPYLLLPVPPSGRQLVTIMNETTSTSLAKAVACHDVGEYVHFNPRGKRYTTASYLLLTCVIEMCIPLSLKLC